MARDRLACVGYTPTVAFSDGIHGYPGNAPYGRILPTCGVPRIPRPWLDQLQIGGKLLVNISYPLTGELVLLTRLTGGSAVGRFFSTCAGFMPMRTESVVQWPIQGLFAMVGGADGGRMGETRVADRPDDLDNEVFLFLAMILLPSVHAFGAAGTTTIYESPCLVDPTDGSWMHSDFVNGSGTVTQGGPRRLWDELLEAHALWTRLEKPTRER